MSLYNRNIKISPLCQFPSGRINLYGVEENYLESTLERFYLPYEYDESISYDELSNGKKDGIKGLFTDEGLVKFDGDLDS